MLTKNSHICLIECEMSKTSVMKLSSLVDDIFSNNYFDTQDIGVSFFNYLGSQRSIVRIYNENRNSTYPFEANVTENGIQYFFKDTIDGFLSSNNRVFIFEIHSFDLSNADYVADKQIDTVNLEHICLLYHKLSSIGCNFYFFISGLRSENHRYTSVQDPDYFRARTFLFLETIYGINSRIKVLAQFSNRWVSFYHDDNVKRIVDPSQRTEVILNDKRFGRILPLIRINAESYECFQRIAVFPGVYSTASLLEKRIRELIGSYYTRIIKHFSISEMILLDKMMRLDNLFEAIIFLSTMYFIDDPYQLTTEEIEQLHEDCIDYAQGIFQLIENSFYHVITGNENGWGNVAFRIRKNPTPSDLNNKYNYEIHVNDIAKSDSSSFGIINKFISNYPELKDAKIKLKDIFEYNNNKMLNEFLEKDVNIAHHYGLMILNNAVLSHKGLIHVRSSDVIYFSDNPDVEHDVQLPNINGTSYFIRIPIMLDKPEFNHWDNIALENPRFNIKDSKSSMLISKDTANLSSCFFSSAEKINCINTLFSSLNNVSFHKDTVYIIDCSWISTETEYEVLAKTIFLLLCSPNDLERVAFVNMRSKYSVIKIFRQFAMFYNRKGENRTLSNKGVFLVDKEAKLPILLLGHIIDIINEIYALELTGEVDETAATIINCLGRRVNGS